MDYDNDNTWKRKKRFQKYLVKGFSSMSSRRSLIFERNIYFLSELGWVMHVVNIYWGE